MSRVRTIVAAGLLGVATAGSLSCEPQAKPYGVDAPRHAIRQALANATP